MHRQGTIVRFDATRGFGFLRCPQTPADVFFHVRDFDHRSAVPAVGMQVDCEEIHVGSKGPRAMAVRPLGARGQYRPAGAARPAGPAGTPAVPRTSGPSASLPLFVLALFVQASLMLWCVLQHRLPIIVVGVWLLVNLVTFWAYWHDKHAASQQAWRTPERTLHTLSLAGGWPAAWWAQQLLRHKSRKPAFRMAYAATAVAHLVLLGAYAAWPSGLRVAMPS